MDIEITLRVNGAAHRLTADHTTLTDDEIRERMSGNLCRCAAYANIVPAIREVVQQAQEPRRELQEARS